MNQELDIAMRLQVIRNWVMHSATLGSLTKLRRIPSGKGVDKNLFQFSLQVVSPFVSEATLALFNHHALSLFTF